MCFRVPCVRRGTQNSLAMADVKAMVVTLITLWSALVFHTAYGDGECGNTAIKTVAVSMAPCIGAANDGNASITVS